MTTTVLVDADPLVYRVGFAAQHAMLHDILESDTGAILPYLFQGKAARNHFLKEHPSLQSLGEPLEEMMVEPLPYVLQTVKQSLAPLEAMGFCQLFLTGTGNFRNDIATIVKYKGKRDPSQRPQHYEAIRQYLIEHKGATVIDGKEADDEVSIQANRLRNLRRSYCVATIDKDLDQIPGTHYDYAKHIKYEVSEHYARRWFWIQALAGDATDCVPGCWKIGQSKAAALVDTWMEDKLSDAEIWESVVVQYGLSTKKAKCPYTAENAEAAALETARLVYMLKEDGEMWSPPK